ncbi:MAG: hypothetical protein ACLQU3_14235 [Limisphaerales bacterium]
MSNRRKKSFTAKPPLERISVAISTVNRPGNYLHKLISHLPNGLPIRLIVGSPDYGYLERYRRNLCIEIIGVDPVEWDRIKDFKTAHRASWNYWRCFIYGARPEARKGLLLLEDDVLPARGWEKQLHKTIEQIEVQYGEEYVLALFTIQPHLSTPVDADTYYSLYPVNDYAGSQAMYYPESVRVAFAEYMAAEGRDIYRMGYDLLLREYLKFTGIPLFATAPCLFQHIGEVGTGLWGVADKSWICLRAGHFLRTLPK